MNNNTQNTIQDFLQFTGINSTQAAQAFSISTDDWDNIVSGSTTPGADLMAKMLTYSMNCRRQFQPQHEPLESSAPDEMAVEIEQLETVINLLNGHRSTEIQSIGGLISGQVSRLSDLVKSL